MTSHENINNKFKIQLKPAIPTDTKLNVWIENVLVGQISETKKSKLLFKYDSAYNAYPISLSLPLDIGEQDNNLQIKNSHTFFSNLLAEGDLKRSLIYQKGITSAFKTLEVYGAECAGAISILPENETPYVNKKDSFYEPATLKQLDSIFIGNINALFYELPLRQALAGCQDKITIAFINKEICIPMGKIPSTYILKPQSRRFSYPGLTHLNFLDFTPSK